MDDEHRELVRRLFAAATAQELGNRAEARLIDEAVDQLSKAPPGRLVAITHWDEGASG